MEKISKLTHDNVRAIREIDPDAEWFELVSGSSAVLMQGPRDTLTFLDRAMSPLPRKGYPKAALHAVRRKLVPLVQDELDAAERAESETEIEARLYREQHGEPDPSLETEARLEREQDGVFRPAEGATFQVMKGYGYDDELFRVIEYAPIVAPPEKIQELYHLPELPTEAVECWHLERHDGEWVGVQRHAFPTSIMVPEGSTAKAYSAINGGAAKPRTRKSGGSSTTGNRCEHCGEPTKGGRFIPGHDAKLKGDLKREASIESNAEAILRGWQDPTAYNIDTTATKGKMDPKAPEKIAALVEQGDTFLAARIAERIGE